MKLENEFSVPAPVEQAWSVLLDVERVAPCLPGAAIEPGGDGNGGAAVAGAEHAGTMSVKIGPITSRFTGTVRIAEADEAARRAVLRAQATDARGQGTAAATITTTMREAGGATRVRVETDLRVTGPAAQFGRGVMQDVSAKLMGRFADCLAAEMGAGAPAAADDYGPAAAPGPPPAEAAAAPAEPLAAPPAAPDARVIGPRNPAADVPPGPAAESARRAAATPSPAAAPPPRPRPTADVLDLGEVGRAAVLKRAVPAAAALVVLLLVLARLLRRR